MSASGALRLLPWTSTEGKPCFLVGDGTGYLSRVADDIEAVQLTMGSELLAHAHHMLDNPKVPTGELRFLAARLAEALGDVLRVAESRGRRLPAPEYESADPIDPDDLADGEDEPDLRAEAHE